MRTSHKYFVLVLAICLNSACKKEDENIIIPPKEVKFPGPQRGTGWEEYTFTYNIQKPWNLNVNERYSYDNDSNEHTFMVLKGDEPFKEGDTTSPRCEMRILNDYTEGNQQFEADYFVYSGSIHPVIMQVFGYPLAINLKAYGEDGGTLKWFDSHDITTKIYDKWIHLNVVHMFKEKKIYIYVNGRELGAFVVKEPAPSYYFKCGVYTSISDTSRVKIKNIKCYKKVY